MKIKRLLLLVLVLMASITCNFAQGNFDKTKDLLLANYDIKADEDDIHSATAFACMLRHPDLAGVKYFAVAGAYGTQGCNFVATAVPGLYNTFFGAQNTNWTDANSDRANSIIRVRDRIKATIDAGGRVFVAEAGQSDVTYDALQAVIGQGISAATIKARVIVVQHSQFNEDNTTQFKLSWVKANTTYNRIADGNVGGNGTPGYNDGNVTFLNGAKAATNPNAAARNLWTQSDAVCDAWTTPGTNCFTNAVINGGGVDFSDNVEMWWIFNVGVNADNVTKFFARYVTNGTSTGGVDDVIGVTNPASVAQGQSVTVTVNYSASTSRDIVSVFQLGATPFTNYVENRTTVAAGTNQNVNLTLVIPSTTPVAAGTYQFQTFITTVGGDWNTKQDFLAKGGVSCTGATQQGQLIPNGNYTMKANSNVYLTATTSSTFLNSRATENGNFTKFAFRHLGNEVYEITSVQFAGQRMEVPNGATGAGQKVAITTYTGAGESLKWKASKVGSSFMFEPNHNLGFALDAYAAQPTIVHLWNKDATNTNQLYSLINASGAPLRQDVSESKLDENELLSGVSIYPNPAHGSFTIDMGNVDKGTLEGYDLTGRLIKSAVDLTTGKNVIKTEGLDGTVILHIKANNAASSTRLIIQN
jgi:Secretion system C-terminal sorting domain